MKVGQLTLLPIIISKYHLPLLKRRLVSYLCVHEACSQSSRLFHNPIVPLLMTSSCVFKRFANKVTLRFLFHKFSFCNPPPPHQVESSLLHLTERPTATVQKPPPSPAPSIGQGHGMAGISDDVIHKLLSDGEQETEDIPHGDWWPCWLCPYCCYYWILLWIPGHRLAFSNDGYLITFGTSIIILFHLCMTDLHFQLSCLLHLLCPWASGVFLVPNWVVASMISESLRSAARVFSYQKTYTL